MRRDMRAGTLFSGGSLLPGVDDVLSENPLNLATSSSSTSLGTAGQRWPPDCVCTHTTCVPTLLVYQHYLCGDTRVSTLLGAKCWHSASGTPCQLCFGLPALCVCASTTCEPTLLVCHHYLSWTATVASCAEAHSGGVVWTGPGPDVTRPCPLGPEWFKSRSCPILEYFNPGLVQIPE